MNEELLRKLQQLYGAPGEWDVVFGDLPDISDAKASPSPSRSDGRPSLPVNAVPGRAYNLRRISPRNTIRRASMHVGIRRVTMQRTADQGGKTMWLCEAICPACGKTVTLNIPWSTGDYYIHCPHCRSVVHYSVGYSDDNPYVGSIWS